MGRIFTFTCLLQWWCTFIWYTTITFCLIALFFSFFLSIIICSQFVMICFKCWQFEAWSEKTFIFGPHIQWLYPLWHSQNFGKFYSVVHFFFFWEMKGYMNGTWIMKCEVQFVSNTNWMVELALLMQNDFVRSNHSTYKKERN